MHWWQRILPPTKLERDLVWQCVLSAFATGTFLTGTAVYFTQVVGSPAPRSAWACRSRPA